ncbi:unnamed protein product [Closterium sp. NIES-53]
MPTHCTLIPTLFFPPCSTTPPPHIPHSHHRPHQHNPLPGLIFLASSPRPIALPSVPTTQVAPSRAAERAPPPSAAAAALPSAAAAASAAAGGCAVAAVGGKNAGKCADQSTSAGHTGLHVGDMGERGMVEGEKGK